MSSATGKLIPPGVCPFATPRTPSPRRLCSNAVIQNMKHLLLLLTSLSVASFSVTSEAAEPWHTPSTQIDAVYPQVEALYLDLHSNPELSFHEEKTAAKIASQLRKLGYDVTTNFGGTGVVGVLKNGAGPVVMLRAELDALPVPEKTGLALRQPCHHAR